MGEPLSGGPREGPPDQGEVVVVLVGVRQLQPEFEAGCANDLAERFQARLDLTAFPAADDGGGPAGAASQLRLGQPGTQARLTKQVAADHSCSVTANMRSAVLPRYGCVVLDGQCVSRLPGEELVSAGIRDLNRELESVEALVVSIGAPRLRRLGLPIGRPIPMAEQRLYDLLADKHGDAAHSRYNALVRRLVSFERAAGAGLRNA